MSVATNFKSPDCSRLVAIVGENISIQKMHWTPPNMNVQMLYVTDMPGIRQILSDNVNH